MTETICEQTRYALESGERQVAPTLAGIRKDHSSRYLWAAERVKGLAVLDAGCGIGYGAKVLADAGCVVTAIDASDEALSYGLDHYRSPRIAYRLIDLAHLTSDLGGQRTDAVVAFELIEHLEDPAMALRAFRGVSSRLLLSVPNEAAFPWSPEYTFHRRHYTAEQIEALLNETGWAVQAWHGQRGPDSPVFPNIFGRTIVIEARASDAPTGGTWREAVPDPAPETELDWLRRVHGPVPESVAIVAMGPSSHAYLTMAASFGGCNRVAHEVWVVNALGNVLSHDRLFAMDDMRIQEARAAASPKGHVHGLLSWMKTYEGRLYTSRAYPDYPGTIAYPLQAVLNVIGYPYLNNSVAAPLALAIALGVKKIHLYGCDYTYHNRMQAEEGRGCIEFLLGIAYSRGITVQIPTQSSLLGANVPADRRFYGYDTQDVTLEVVDERFQLTFADRPPERIPSAAEMERRYDHGPVQTSAESEA